MHFFLFNYITVSPLDSIPLSYKKIHIVILYYWLAIEKNISFLCKNENNFQKYLHMIFIITIVDYHQIFMWLMKWEFLIKLVLSIIIYFNIKANKKKVIAQ